MYFSAVNVLLGAYKLLGVLFKESDKTAVSPISSDFTEKFSKSNVKKSLKKK